MTIEANLKVLTAFHHMNSINPKEAQINQKQITTTRARFNVTTCRYLGPNNRARSLSTLIAVDVNWDTPHKTKLKTWTTISLTSLIRDRRNVAKNGCTRRPTQRSVTARHRKNSFVEGWIEDTLCRAIRIRPLPRDAVMDRKMFNAEKNAITPTGGKLSTWLSLLVKFPSPVMFAIVL